MYVWEPVRETVALVKGGKETSDVNVLRHVQCTVQELFNPNSTVFAVQSLVTSYLQLFVQVIPLQNKQSVFFPRHTLHTAGKIYSPGFCQ